MKRIWKTLLALGLALCLLAALSLGAFADFGDFGGDDDWGNDDWVGGWDDDDWGGWDDDDDDWGGWDDDDDDWGGGNDWAGWNDDDDWGGGWNNSQGWSSSSGGSGGSGSSRSGTSRLKIILLVLFILIALIFGAVFLTHFIGVWAKRQRSGIAQARYSDPISREGPEEGLLTLEQYQALDPAFDWEEMKQKLSDLYVEMQQKWQDRDIEALRPWFTDVYFSQLERQVADYRSRGIINYVREPTVLRIELEGVREEPDADELLVLLRGQLIDYKVREDTGKLISGSRSRQKLLNYRYHLVRPTSGRGKAQAQRNVTCPNCGSALTVAETGKCPYCGSLVTVEAQRFVISRIEALSQRTL